MQPLTLGQLAVREVVYGLLPEYSETGSDKVCEKLMQRIAEDKRITQDKWTGRSLDYCYEEVFSQRYINHLFITRELKSRRINNPEPLLPKIRHFCNYSSCVDTAWNDLYLYKGGSYKPETVPLVLFAIANEKKINRHKWHLIYYPELALLEFSDGQHRTIAHLLWGAPMWPKTYSIVTFSSGSTGFNKRLNRLFLDSEKMNVDFEDIESMQFFWQCSVADRQFLKEWCSPSGKKSKYRMMTTLKDKQSIRDQV